ncbi:hypothetical protein SAMN05421837_103896 [Amycolatopsis pretoriensis]|uniref:Uncharacterized protein n=1 Tax=Amycolatopsis pretoriensis TaxID=218821 RepID=A0A1H5QQK9_9PSEU|nr:hypothetical protein SAMN05421837_103896 [Amycolatopsis pretoriensis]
MRVVGPDEPLGVPYVEMETFFHGPGWTVRETWQAASE